MKRVKEKPQAPVTQLKKAPSYQPELAGKDTVRYCEVVELKQIEDEALGLPESLRAGLALRLFQSLPASSLEVTDEEVMQRDQELENGTLEALSHEEFLRRVETARGR